MNKLLTELFYIIPFVIISTIFSFAILLVSYPIHELGHASFATLVAMTQQNPTITLNFTYQQAFYYFKMPQQTIALLPTHPLFTILFGIAGVFTTTIFYFLIFIFITNLKKVKTNKGLQNTLSFAFLTLVIGSILENLVCGTDGLKLTCSSWVLKGISLLVWLLFALFVTIFIMAYLKIEKRTK